MEVWDKSLSSGTSQEDLHYLGVEGIVYVSNKWIEKIA